MAAKKPGRPFVYQSDDEKPVTVSLRIPRDVYEQARRYVRMRSPMTLTELLLDGLLLRLETPADPRDMILSDDNTVMRQLQDMVDAAVQAALTKVHGTATSDLDTPKLAPALEAPAVPTPDMQHYDNTVLQIPKAPGATPAQRKGGRPRGIMGRRILALLADHPEGLSAEAIRVHLGSERPLGDTLQGLRRQHAVKTRGSGRAMRYFSS
jgi:hypothetical protein